MIEFLPRWMRNVPTCSSCSTGASARPGGCCTAIRCSTRASGIEAASPSDLPAPYARQSVIQKVDQAQWVANSDVPPLGKDSLGVWLSDWPWNSQIGKDRWQGGFVDGHLPRQPAGPALDRHGVAFAARTPADGRFHRLVESPPACFGNSRFILGNPWKNEPYGYCCTDGRRAFLALHNGCWQDSLSAGIELGLGTAGRQAWDLYRWWPDPARLQGEAAAFGAKSRHQRGTGNRSTGRHERRSSWPQRVRARKDRRTPRPRHSRILCATGGRLSPRPSEHHCSCHRHQWQDIDGVLLRDLWVENGHNALCLGTLGLQARDKRHSNLEAGLTTYDAKTLHTILAELERVHGVTHLAMEASSHALDQQRLAG